MAKNKSTSKRRPTPSTPEILAAHGGGWHAFRETIESIVIAFVLAFLFRTFEAEAFVIPTGSMSPSLQGRHKDVDCSECGYRFRTTASEEERDTRLHKIAQLNRRGLSYGARQQLEAEIASYDIVAGTCPMCRQTMPFRTDLQIEPPDHVSLDDVEQQTSYPGDRILVNKYCYLYEEPKRWDVVVFKYPGNGEMNYIKRLIGLPGEELQIYQGDIFTRSLGSKDDFKIERKPPEKQHVMLQTVHDSNYESATLYQAGWPLRWAPTNESQENWQVKADVVDQTVEQEITFNSENSDSTQWLRYRHLLPSNYDWIVARDFKSDGEHKGTTKEAWLDAIRPQLIRDFNAYNAQILRGEEWNPKKDRYGMHWVGDLAIECEVEIEKLEGELHLDLVEAGKHFTCRIDLESGQATFSIEGLEDFKPTTKTAVNGPGEYQLLFANVDDQLLLWIDGDLVDFGDTTYQVEQVFGKRAEMLPVTNEDDPGDLSPVGIGARGASLKVNRLQVKRDIYYIATSWKKEDIPHTTDYTAHGISTDLKDGTHLPRLRSVNQLFSDPSAWPRFLTRQSREFDVEEGQLFVMGDNSPASSDCRLWFTGRGFREKPGGPYLDRDLLIGKAVMVFWPHSWGSIPGLQRLPGFPNFGDMRIVR